jgi:endonuclease/exonuclease/phosphatase family metal-dependent hydrolase
VSALLRAESFALASLLGVAACGDDAVTTGPSTSSSGGGSATSTSASGQGGAGGIGAGGATSTSTGAGGGDLGWPYDDDVPQPCAPLAPSSGGAAWAGWANLQFPASLAGTIGQATAPIYGQVYQAGTTPLAGQAPGFEAQLLVGPLGVLPTGEARCFTATNASFNVDAGNNDEWQASHVPQRAGLYGMYYRFRPSGGAYRYGDLNGSDDGVGVEQAAVLEVGGAAPAPLVVATLNLRCRLDDWPARKPLVIAALARIDPDLVALQEDCLDTDGAQAAVIAAELGAYTRRGYEHRRVTTHLAGSGNESFEEGIAVLSAHRIGDTRVLDLPYANFPRKALALELVVRGKPLRFYATHFDYGTANAAVRKASADAILADLPTGTAAIVAGDLNAEPSAPGPIELAAALGDAWLLANPSQLGLTMPASAPTRRIDYVYATSSLEPLGACMLDDAAGGVWLSDHLGVAAAFDW